jgi:broad specificity phosphatase PhoE
MRILEIRRHTMRNKLNEHISSEGIDLAQFIGSKLDPFDLVVTSPVLRVIETAVAMGFAVDETRQVLSELSSDVFHNSGWPASYDELHKTVNDHRNVSDFAKTQAQAWRDIVGKNHDKKRILIVTHGLFVELGTIANFPNTSNPGCHSIGYCEGIRILIEDEKFLSYEVLRVPADRYSVNN